MWIPEFLPSSELIKLYSLASVFICPSIYEPFGLINIEAMACATPVVGAAVGGIPEIVVDGQTGFWSRLRPKRSDPEPKDPEGYSRSLAESINRLLDAPGLAREMGKRGRRRVEEIFSWKCVASRPWNSTGMLIDEENAADRIKIKKNKTALQD